MLEDALRWYGISRKELAEMLRISLRTLQRRMADPATWTVGEIERLGGILGWTKKDLAEFVERCTSSPVR